MLTIADALVEDTHEDGDVVCTQGEVGDAFYIIKKVFLENERGIDATLFFHFFMEDGYLKYF